MQSPKNQKKQQQLPPSKSKPEVLQAKVLAPDEIEKEILLKKIESLQYTVREKETINRKLTDDLYWTRKINAELERQAGYFEKRMSQFIKTLNTQLDTINIQSDTINLLDPTRRRNPVSHMSVVYSSSRN